MNALWTVFATVAVVVWGYMTAWYIVSRRAGRSDVADIAWGLGFVVASATALAYTMNRAPAALTVMLLVSLWGGRLSWHIWLRNHGKPEDYRYVAQRSRWGSYAALRSYLQIFIAQGILLLVIVSPVLVTITYAAHGIPLLLVVGTLVWVVGYIFESTGDRQLRAFKSNPTRTGRILDSGLWRYSRHPNYFGEVTQWWGIGIIALSCPYGWIGLIGPVVITFLIVKVSGVPLLEQKYADNPDYQAYKRRTSMLIPLPPRSR